MARIRVRSKSTNKSSSEVKPLVIDESALCLVKDYEVFRNSATNSVNRFTVKVDLMPSWYAQEAFILDGYRRITRSYKGCLLSLTYLHNETGNVYTHLIGALCVVPMSYYLYFVWMRAVETNTIYDYIVHATFLAGLFACLGLSTVFHLCCCHSKHVSKFCNKADYVGIVALQMYSKLKISGSFIPTLFYGFYCDPFFQKLYIISIVSLGLLTITVTIGPQFASTHYRWLRTGLFTLFGALGIVPAIHHTFRYGLSMALQSFALLDVIQMGLLYLVGAFVYAYRFPERFFPGTFDIIGHSHQIWHLFVLGAAGTHFFGIFKIYSWWHLNNPNCLVSDETMISWFK